MLLVCVIIGYVSEILILFLFVLIHEFCHIILARVYKLKVKNIELFPFGGVARIDNLDYVGTSKEIVITIAGPLFNLLAAMLLFFLTVWGISVPYQDYIINVNLTLGIFNLLPGMPLDGGRILRALLCYFIGFKKAAKASIISGKIISGILFICGIFSLVYGKLEISLLVMPFFIFLSANKEENTIMFIIIKDIINKKKHLKSKRVMEARELCVYEDTSISEILKYFDYNKYHLIFILGKSLKVEGILTESEIFDNLSLDFEDLSIGELNNKIKKNSIT
jgi:stage IV sporulation protein FB